MIFKTHYIVIFLSTLLLFGQSDDLGLDNTSQNKALQGAFGAVTIDGKIWNQLALRPVLPFGKLSVAFDIVLYIDQNGNIYDEGGIFPVERKLKIHL